MGLSVQALLKTIRHWWIVLLLVPLGCGLVAYGFGMTRTPMYASTATLLVSISSSSTLDGYNANLLAQDLTTTYQTLVTTDPVLQAVAASADPPVTAEQLRDNTSVTASTGALFMITVVDADPARAATLVNAITAELTQFVAALSTAGNGEYPGTVTTVVRGSEPPNPYAPRLPAYAALGVIGGLLLANGIILLFERLDIRVRNGSDLPALTGLARLANIPSLRKQRFGRATIFLDDADVSQASESIRAVRNAILSLPRKFGTVVAISSPNEGDGKTMVAANLAAAMARTGKLVLLVDGNLREPRLHTIFELDNTHGLGTLLADPEVSWRTAAIQVAPNLAVLPAGSTSVHPSDFLMSNAFGNLMRQLLTSADMVIIDTPSVDVANDAIAIATYVDNVVLVCRTGKTRIPDLSQTRESFAATGATVLGVVVNRGAGNRPTLTPQRLGEQQPSSGKALSPAESRIAPGTTQATSTG